MNEMDRSRRMARRTMAWLSFGLLMAEAVALLLGVFLGGPLFAANMAAASPVINGVLWSQVAIIAGYLGVSLTEALKRGAAFQATAAPVKPEPKKEDAKPVSREHGPAAEGE